MTPDNIADAFDHDLSVRQRAAQLHRWKFKNGNDENMELFVTKPASDGVSHLFAVCVDTHEKAVMVAAAKLLLQKTTRTVHPSAMLLLPEDKMEQYAHQMRRLHIDVLGFRVEGEKIFFPDLGKIRHDQDEQR